MELQDAQNRWESQFPFSFKEDELGIVQKLLFNHTLQGSPEGVLRLLGFVHLYSASGIHLYVLLNGLEVLTGAFSTTAAKFKWFRAIPLVIILFFPVLWSLQNYRFGFLRPFTTWVIRWVAKRLGFGFHSLVPILMTAILDFSISKVELGRLHYYGAVIGGLWMTEIYKKHIRTPAAFHLGLALGSWIFIASYEFWFEHRITWMTPLWSLITLPVVCSVFYPLLILSYFLTQVGYVQPLGWMMKIMNSFIRILAETADALHLNFWVIDTRWILSSACVALFLLLVGYRKKLLKTLGFNYTFLVFVVSAAILTMLFYIEQRPYVFSEVRRVVQWNVGQGDALLIQKQPSTRNEVVDVGSYRTSQDSVWLERFSKQSVHKIDGLLFSHLDEDHTGAIKRISRLIPIHCIEYPINLLPEGNKDHQWKQIFKDWASSLEPKVLPYGCMRLAHVYGLQTQRYAENQNKKPKRIGNDRMNGVIVPLDQKTVYLAAGDASSKLESQFLDQTQEIWKKYPYKIWKVSHHGSLSSSDFQLLQKLSPQEAWISVGYKNHYGHPRLAVLQRFYGLGIRVKRTDQDGDLSYSHGLLSHQ